MEFRWVSIDVVLEGRFMLARLALTPEPANGISSSSSSSSKPLKPNPPLPAPQHRLLATQLFRNDPP